MFNYNAVCVMSDMTTSKAGTITSGEDRYMEWKTTDGHYENYRADLLTGKAMIVAYSRPIAMEIYNKILELRPNWIEKVGAG